MYSAQGLLGGSGSGGWQPGLPAIAPSWHSFCPALFFPEPWPPVALCSQVWFGAFPIVINLWAAVAITVYYTASTILMYYTRSLGHLKVLQPH